MTTVDHRDAELLWSLWREVNNEPNISITQSKLVAALNSPQLEIRNLARIIADRRGIQVVDTL